ncbi:MAG: hypothetical protein LKJ90_01160 [Faecalibacterium sp.]|jgi:hypothetical protein|nr:hypothetical protein [Faecalibacterium sp.]
MRNMTKRLLALALAAVMTATLAGCTIDLTGGDGEDEETTTKWAESSTDTITLPQDMDATARFATELVDNSMYVVFNGIQKRDTGYFSAPNGSLTFTVNATAEAEKLQKFKIAMWKLVDGGTEYVDGTTVYYKTDGTCYSYTVEGLDASARYRLTLSYDKVSYYMYGQVRVDGVGEMGAAPDEADSAASSGAAA